MLVERPCSWLRITGVRASQDLSDGISGFDVDSAVYQLGAQFELERGWLLGGSLAYVTDRTTSDDGLDRANADAGYGALTLKRQTGPWLWSAAVFGGAGEVDIRRAIVLQGLQSQATGQSDTSSWGALLRAAYTLGDEANYLRPSLTLSAVRQCTGAYRESGGGALALDVSAEAQTTWIVTPAVEVGGRIALEGDKLLRPYLSAGVSWLSNDGWTQSASFIGAPAGSSRFSTTVTIDPVVARLGAGVQLYSGDNASLRLHYEGEFSKSLRANSLSVVGSISF
jgi:outer membrane autotransporter protein